MDQAENAYTSLTGSVAQGLTGGQQTPDQLEVSLNENLPAVARAQAASVEQQASEPVTATHDQISTAATGGFGQAVDGVGRAAWPVALAVAI